MKTLLLSIAVLVSSAVFGQRITLSSMIKIQTSNVVDAEDVLIGLGFSHEDSRVIGSYNIFAYSKNSNSTTDYINVSKFTFNNIQVKTTLFTIHRTDFIALKSSIKNHGFNYIKSSKDNGVTIHQYSDGKYLLEIDISDESGFPSYFISLTNIKNQETYFNAIQ